MFSIEKSNIISELQSLSNVADKKQTLPVLSNVLIRCNSDKVQLKSTDLEVELEVTLTSPTITKPAEITIPAKKISDIVKELPEGPLSFELSDDATKMVVKSSSGKYNLSTIPAADFPDFDIEASENFYEVESEDLLSLIGKTSFAMANQDWRHYLNGCYIEKSLNALKMVATDAHRLAIYELVIEGEGEFKGIIPRKTVIEIMRILPKNETIKFYLNTSNIVFMSKNFTFKSKLIDGNYPNYNQVVPSGDGIEIRANRKDLLDSLSRVSVLSNDKFKGVKLTANSNYLDVTAHNPEQESAEEKLELKSSVSGFDVAFNVNYLREILSTIEDEDISIVSYGPDKSAAILSSDQNQTLVLMPLLL